MSPSHPRKLLLRFSVAISPEAEEPAAALLERIFARPASIHIDARTGATSASVFLENPKELSRAKQQEIRHGLRQIQFSGLNIGSGKISVRPLKRENWAESWKRHFPPIEIGSALLVKAPWSTRRPQEKPIRHHS